MKLLRVRQYLSEIEIKIYLLVLRDTRLWFWFLDLNGYRVLWSRWFAHCLPLA